MTLKNPFLEKVFLALRPNFFPDEPREHITLKYYEKIRWDTLIDQASRLDKHLPAVIEPVMYSTWQAWGKSEGPWYQGLIVDCMAQPILNHLHMPHITLTDVNKKPMIGDLEAQIVDTLWIGKSINKQLHWAKVSSKQIEANYDFTGIPPHIEFDPDARRKEVS